MAQISLEEAIRLGLVPEEELQRLADRGILGSPFARTAGRGTSPFWRVPPITRGGLFQPRFGLGPLSQGLALSPAAPAISGGGVPVGRRNLARNQGPPSLDTLIGTGDVNEIARRVASGEVNPNQLPPALRQQVLQILQSQRRQPERPAGPDDTQKGLAVAKQVLSIAKSLLPSNSKAAQIIEAQEQQVVQQEPAVQTQAGETQQGQTQPTELPATQGQPVAPIGQDERARLEALGFSPDQIAQMLNAMPSAPPVPMGRGELTIGGRTESTPIPLVGDRPADIMVKNAEGVWEVVPAELQQAINAGTFNAADVKALANQGFTAAEIQDALTPIDALGAGVDVTPTGGGAAPESSVGPGAIIGGLTGAATIGQAVTDENANDAQKALRATSGAGQIAQAAAPVLGYASAVPYLAAATGLANIGVTAAGPGPSDQKAASAAIDAAATAVSVGLAASGYGALLIPFVQPIASLVKMNIMKAFGLDHKTREAIEANTTGNRANRLMDQIQATKSEGELYNLLRAWSTPLVGGSSMNNDPRLGGEDPMPVNVYAQGEGRPSWNYLGLYGSGGLNPNAPTPREFFDRILQNPEDLQVQIQAGIKPELMAPMNAAIRDNLREQIAELRVREYVRPNIMSFSKMAGVIVAEDDVVDALRKTRGVIDSPDFVNFLRQAERDRVAREATAQAMGNQPFLAPAKYGSTDNLREEGAQAQYLYLASQNEPDKVPHASEVSPNDYARSLALAGFTPEGQQTTGQVDIPPRTYRAVEAGYVFKPGLGWVDSQGNVAYATGPLPEPEPFVEPTATPQPPSTATPASAPAPDATGAPVQPGQSAVPPGSPLAPPPEEQPAPLGIMDQGGVIPRSGPYQLAAGETVLPSPHDVQDDPEVLRRFMPNMDYGGVVPRSGIYRMQAGETVIPAGHADASGIPAHGRLQSWIEDGRVIQSTTQPQPSLKNPSLLWIQDEENQWHLIDPLDYPEVRYNEEADSEKRDQGTYYLDPKRGVPFAAGSNPDPSKTWRLVFEPDELHDAWKQRQKDGAPLLVPRSVLNRRDWPDVVEKARQSQYVAVHPSILLAREMPQGALGGRSGDQPGDVEDLDSPETVRRFWEGSNPVPTPETTPPMRQMPPRRPMRPDEADQIDWGGVPA